MVTVSLSVPLLLDLPFHATVRPAEALLSSGRVVDPVPVRAVIRARSAIGHVYYLRRTIRILRKLMDFLHPRF
ncbi:hypothetical protein OHB41_43850 [Streptomyces sp. NBC_01571]|uniref:hypothetical protein n=1 Tax=Streptomyces sp. NBC_01571 TaxID=2975883 RepID=UPI00225566D5|nr:hypothetical protein [Streptomyces sp. NBC_01571]MCX4579984.1 hypothetical protein [Streptomyces sp. NBC_01571]